MNLLFSKARTLGVLLLVLVAAFSSVSAQTSYGGLRGEVKDSQGAVISGAEITLTNEDTKISRSAVTNSAGVYLFGGVDPGTYKVTISMSGFKTFDSPGHIVSLGVTATADASLQIGSKGETIEVTADSLELQTSTASGGQLYNAQQVEDLPLLGRNPFMLEAFDANVVTLGDPRYVRAEDQTGSSQVSLAGAPSNSNSYVVDGIPISTSSGGVTFIPTVEAVSDAKIQANTYDAEVGRSGGGIFASDLKSGSSQYHGVLYGETRQTGWSGNLWFNHFAFNGAGAPTPSDETYIYEGAFGGPLVPPSLKDKAPHWLDQTFYWLDEAGYRQGQPLTGVTTSFYTPTAAERSGDFSAYAPNNGSLTSCTGAQTNCYILYDPTTFPRVSFLQETGANKIPTSYLNPLGQYTVNQFPSPTASYIYGTTGQSYNFSNPSSAFKSRDDTYSGKLEHTFFPWYTASASYVHSAIQEPSGNALIVPFASSTKLLRYTDATAVNNTFTLNPTTLLTVAYGYNRYYSASFQYSTGFNAATGFGGTGFPTAFASQLQSATFPAISLSSVSGAAGIGASNGGPTVYASHNVVAVASKTLGRHTIKAGYEYRGFDVYTNPTSGGAGAFTFDGQYTNSTGLSDSGSPRSIADLLVGQPSSATVTLNSGVFINKINYNSLFAQDDFRFNSKLTINAGLRYEYEPGQTEQHNRYNVGFDPKATGSYINAAGSTVNFTGALAFAGQNGEPTHCCNNSHTKFSPRIGISYSPDTKTVVHAGYGVFFAPVGIAAATTGYSQTSTYSITSATAGVAVGNAAYLSNPFPSGLLQPTGNTLGPLTGLGSSLTGSSTYAFTTGLQDFQKRVPFVEQYSLDVEREVPWGVMLKVGYYGAHARNYANYTNINQLSDSVMASYSPGGANYGQSLGTKVTNPFYAKTIGGLPATGTVSTATVAQGQLLLPFPQFGAVYVLRSSGYSKYNSLVFKAEKHTRNGLTMLATYTWSANWDNIWSTGSQIYSSYGPQDAYNPKGEYARSLNSIPNRATAAVTYELPFGHGKKYLAGANRLVDSFVGGWSISDEWIDQNGVPLSIQQTDLSSGTYGTTGIGGTYQRPNLAGDAHSVCGSGKPQTRLGNFSSAATAEAPYIKSSALTPAAPYTYGNAPRMLPCRAPGYDAQNISVFKDIKISERFTFQFRAEALNAMNTPEFAPPSLSYTVSTPASVTSTPAASSTQTFGNITTTVGFARIIQLGGRLSF